MSKIYHVAKTGLDTNLGTANSPFLTIGAAANLAKGGDRIVVHEGEYREWVKPQFGGLSNTRRIVYEAAKGEKVVIKGSEQVKNWEHVEGTVWRVILPNSFFGDFNPYQQPLIGDWVIAPVGRYVHLGDVYLNGMSFYEGESYEAVLAGEVRTQAFDQWANIMVPIKDVDQTKYLWLANVDEENTVIFANFHGVNPNEELVEINVRKCCFYPERAGINYITVRGFEMAQAATPWTPPTADQPGLVGPHWSRGWIIEDNIIHDSKCSGISLGKEVSTGDNFRTFRKDKPGYQYQLESVFVAEKAGWSKERIGSHTVRNNIIYNCGQNAIVGHMGCVFSKITGNHIYNIGLKREFLGWEIAGIKLHAPIDVEISHNRIHDCSMGTWLDWQTQGTGISKNLFYNNVVDFYAEVSHGPYLVDHNIFASAIVNWAQGGAYVNNLFAGKIVIEKVLDRATPYHTPHSTEVAGFAVVYGGDDRFFENLFIGGGEHLDSYHGGKAGAVGTAVYDNNPSSLEEYIEAIDRVHQVTPGDHNLFNDMEQPVYITGNAYIGEAQPYVSEKSYLKVPDFDVELKIEEAKDGVYLYITLPHSFDDFVHAPRNTESLGRVRIVDADFENPDGSPLTLDTDYLNMPKGKTGVVGPIGRLKAGENKVKVWSKD
jgi:hypothetical protein